MATDKLLRLIIKLDQVAVLFTSFEDLFKRWLEYAQDLSVERQVSYFNLCARIRPTAVTASICDV